MTVFSKGLRRKKNVGFIGVTRWDNRFFVHTTIVRSGLKLISINKHICGSLSTQPYINGMLLGQYLSFSNLPQKFWKINQPGNYAILRFLDKYGVFSNIFIKNVRRYATANGTFCQVLDHFYDFNLTKFSLPSRNTKIISSWSFVLLGRNAQIDFKYNRLCKAGISIHKGMKPKVRGVARNPVDHPHGGRTKTNQPEVSIWGWVAKKNK